MSETTEGETREFRYGRSTIEYTLWFEERNQLAITVNPDKSVEARAPLNTSLDAVEERLSKRGQWVLKQINYFDQFHPIQPSREYVAGETHYYLGRQYRLRIRKAGADKEGVKLIGKFFQVATPHPADSARIKSLMQQWYADHARLVIDRRAEAHAERILGESFPEIELRYQFMSRRWGSCSPNGKVTFNIELIKTPMDCVDYVIVHELCHVVHANHDKAFYGALGKVLPDWEARKARLEVFGTR